MSKTDNYDAFPRPGLGSPSPLVNAQAAAILGNGVLPMHDNAWDVETLTGHRKYVGSTLGGVFAPVNPSYPSETGAFYTEVGFQQYSPVVNGLLGESGTFLPGPDETPVGYNIVGFNGYTSTESPGPGGEIHTSESFVNPIYGQQLMAYIASDDVIEYETDDAGGIHWKDRTQILTLHEPDDDANLVGQIVTPAGQKVKIYSAPVKKPIA